jgi:threonine dehydrogenase-like Zn-dependent dehydrogenase
MLALVNGSPPRLVRDRPEPERRAGEALLSMRLAGICDTDLQLARGYLGHRGVLGHELVARVVEHSDRAWIGRRVVADINAGCGVCAECLSRGGHHCAARTVLGIAGRDGALAERLIMPERCLAVVPDSVSDELAVFAEPLAAALHVLDALPRGYSGPALVLGDGKLGLLVALALRSAGCSVTVIGHHAHKLAIAAAAGAETFLEEDANTARVSAPVVVEATGSEHGLERALAATAPRGTLILKTTVAEKIALDPSAIVIHELNVVGSRCGNVRNALEALSEGRVDPRPLVAACYPLTEADVAFAHAAKRGTLKVLVKGEHGDG